MAKKFSPKGKSLDKRKIAKSSNDWKKEVKEISVKSKQGVG